MYSFKSSVNFWVCQLCVIENVKIAFATFVDVCLVQDRSCIQNLMLCCMCKVAFRSIEAHCHDIRNITYVCSHAGRA